MLETDVLVVGCGPAGLAAATALAHSGVRTLAITRYRQLSPTPRAHATNQRTFEIFRDFGFEAEALARATPYSAMSDFLFMRSLAGAEFARYRGYNVESADVEASPCERADLPQNLLEPILFNAALRRGANIRFSTEFLSLTQHADGVTAELEDRLTGKSMLVRAQYLIGADGGRSRVADSIALPFEGLGEIGGSVNIIFEADLSSVVSNRPGLLYFFIRTAEDPEGPGIGILRAVKPWTSWILVKGYSSGQATPELSSDEAIEAVRAYLGLPELAVRITGVDRWPMNSQYATCYQQDRVFCMGDAVHRHVPSNGLGSNTSIQDAYNLAWKLSLVLRGQAAPSLLETYSQERVPVGRHVVERATSSLQSYGPILEALGVLDTAAPENGARHLAALAENTPEAAARREALQAAVLEKAYEFKTRGIELNQFYRSAAIVDEGQQPPAAAFDLDLVYRPTTCPGAHLPHVWLQRDGEPVSTLDLVGKGRFAILTGIGGEAWIEAAQAASTHFGIPISATAIGIGCPVTDLYFNWARRREIGEDGCLLVRPDGYIAWRCASSAGAESTRNLLAALTAVLGVPAAPGGYLA